MANSLAFSIESTRACQNNFPPVAAKLLVIRHFYSAAGLKSFKADAFSVATGKIWNLVKLDTDEAREIVKDEAAYCPAGRLVIWDKTTGKVIKPKFAAQLGLIEDTEKKVGGPIWVRGGIPARNADGFATMAATSSCNRDLSPPPRMNLEIKSVTRRVACPKGTPRRRKSLVFIASNQLRAVP
jgi:hypothetical protein